MNVFIIGNNLTWLKIITNSGARGSGVMVFRLTAKPFSVGGGETQSPHSRVGNISPDLFRLLFSRPRFHSILGNPLSQISRRTSGCCLFLSELLCQCRQLSGLLSVILGDPDFNERIVCEFFWPLSLLWNEEVFKNFGKRTSPGLGAASHSLCSPFTPGSRSLV